MYYTLGRSSSLSGITRLHNKQTIELGNDLVSDFNFTRTTTATFRDRNGILRPALVNQLRFDHDISGNYLGMILEGASTNICLNRNANPTNTSNMTLGGDAAATLSLVNDATELKNAGLHILCDNQTVYRLDNQAGSTSAFVTIGGTNANTNAHSYSVYARATGSMTKGGFLGRSGASAPKIDFDNSTGYRFYRLTETPLPATGLSLRVSAYAGQIVFFILNQLEEKSFVTSTIITSGGAAVTRAQDRLAVTDIATKLAMHPTKGHVILKLRPYSLNGPRQTLFHANKDGLFSEASTIRIGDDGKLQGFIYGNGQTYSMVNYAQICDGQYHMIGFSWEKGRCFMAADGLYDMKDYSPNPADNPAPTTRLEIGCRNGGLDPFSGHIQTISIGDHPINFKDMGEKLSRNLDYSFLGGGQSNMRGYFVSTVGLSDAGQQAFLTQMRLNYPNDDILFANGATSGSALIRQNIAPDPRWWYDPETGLFGDAWTEFERGAHLLNRKVNMIFWDQGEADAPQINSTEARAQYKQTLFLLFQKMRGLVGNVPIIIVPIGRRGDSPVGLGVQHIREVQMELDAEYSYIHLSPEKIDQPLADTVHLSATGYGIMGQRLARKALSIMGQTVTGGVDGARISGAVRSGLNVTVTLQHESGTDFTPTTGIQGFTFTGGGISIPITNAVRTNATTITLTLGSLPSGQEILYYAYNALSGINTANLVRGNSTNLLPLKAAKIIL